MSLNIRNRIQILMLPDTNCELLWTAEQLRAKGVAATTWRLAAPAIAPKPLSDVPCPGDLARLHVYLHIEKRDCTAPSLSMNRISNSTNQPQTIETGGAFGGEWWSSVDVSRPMSCVWTIQCDGDESRRFTIPRVKYYRYNLIQSPILRPLLILHVNLTTRLVSKA
eukprot:g73270.t1